MLNILSDGSLFIFLRSIFIGLLIVAVIYLVALRLLGFWYTKKNLAAPPLVHLECFATVSGIDGEPVKVQVSARKLPNEGEKLKALCKLSKWTPNGLEYDGAEFDWYFVEMKNGRVFVSAIA